MKLVLFDVDGTLIDSQHMIVAAMTRAFEAEGIAVPARETILSIVGLSLAEAIRVLGQGAPGFPVEPLAAHYRAAFREMRLSAEHHEPLFPGAAEALGRLAARDEVVLGVATGKSRRGLNAILTLHGLDGRFLTLQTADDHPSKPAPDMILRAMSETGADAANTVMIGDTSYDMLMARAAGARGIGVGWGYHAREELHEAGAVCVLSRFDELDAALEGCFTEALS